MTADNKLARTGRWGRIRGNWATLLLPIDSDDGIDIDRLAEEIDLLVAAGVDGIYSNGTAGEFHNQTEAEFETIQELLAGRCKAAGMPFAIGACDANPRHSLELVAAARRFAPDAIQVILPDWWPVTAEEATDFLHMAAEAAGPIPLVLYHPPHAKRVFRPAELAQIIAPLPSVIGIKMGDGDARWYGEARTALDDVGVYVPGHHLATGVAEGVAAGAFSNVACLSPQGAQRWTDSMRVDIGPALELETRIRAFLDNHVRPFGANEGYSNAALDKLLATVGGWARIGTRLRRPYRWIGEERVPPLYAAARRELPELFSR
jgi:dihydrodipicolinate synthase/N-acetylneuraminate lyase